MNVLLIDDEYRGEYTKDYLTLLGYNVDWIKDPKENITSLIDKYNVLILDIMMVIDDESYCYQKELPNHNNLNTGLHILVFIREKLKLSSEQLKVILYTARKEDDIKDVLGSNREKYYDCYVRKSLSDQPLIEYLENINTSL